MRRLIALRCAAIATILITAIAGCSGSHAGTTPAAAVVPHVTAYTEPTPQPVASTGADPLSRYSAPVSLTITVPKAVTSSKTRTKLYISPSTVSLTVTVTPAGGTQSSTNAANCNQGTCTVGISAPIGLDTFTFNLSDATGTLLSTATLQQYIYAAQVNTVSAIFDGVVASVMLSVSPPQLPLGVQGSAVVTAIAKDADGNVIVSPGTYNVPISVTSNDTSGATSLSSNQLDAPDQSITLNYNGNGSAHSFSVSPSAAGIAASRLTAAPVSVVQTSLGQYALGFAAGTNLQQQGAQLGNAAGSLLPASVDLTPNMPPPGFQGNYEESCVAWAAAYDLDTYEDRIGKGWSLFLINSTSLDYTHIASPDYVFYRLNRGVNQGLDFEDALNLLATEGTAPWSDMPGLPDSWTTAPSGQAIADASIFKIAGFSAINSTVRDIQAQVAANNPVLVGISVDTSLETLQSGAIWTSSGSLVGGHALLIVGYNNNVGPNGAFLVQNSWGANWGTNGRFWADYNTLVAKLLDHPYIVKGFTSGPTPTPVPSSTPTPSSTIPAGTYQTTSGTASSNYGGAPYCSYTGRETINSLQLIMNGSGQLSSAGLSTSFFETTNNCSFAALGSQSHSYVLASYSVTPGTGAITVRFNPALANSPYEYATFTGTYAGGVINGTLTFARSDQPGTDLEFTISIPNVQLQNGTSPTPTPAPTVAPTAAPSYPPASISINPLQTNFNYNDPNFGDAIQLSGIYFVPPNVASSAFVAIFFQYGNGTGAFASSNAYVQGNNAQYEDTDGDALGLTPTVSLPAGQPFSGQYTVDLPIALLAVPQGATWGPSFPGSSITLYGITWLYLDNFPIGAAPNPVGFTTTWSSTSAVMRLATTQEMARNPLTVIRRPGSIRASQSLRPTGSTRAIAPR